MRVTLEKIEELSTDIVHFYTVRIGNNKLTEFELFDEKDFPNHTAELTIIYSVLSLIAEKKAKSYYFKNESSAEALPVVPQAVMKANKDDFGLRLYCKRVSEHLVILLNGDIKTNINPKDCPNVKPHFLRAIKIGLKLDRAIQNKDIDLNDPNPFIEFEFDL